MLSVLLLISFGIDWENVTAGGTIDFRNRITGARLLMQHEDAYHYKWRSGGPEELCDPFNNLALPVNKVTVTPTLLMLNFPLGLLNYRTAQFVWLVLQWLLLLGTAAVWLRAMPGKVVQSLRDGSPAHWLWLAAVVGFTFTVSWRHHADRGQAYVVMTFLLSVWITMTRSESHRDQWWTGLLAGLLIALRPPFLLLLAPFIALRRRGQIAGAVIGLIVFAGMPLLWDSSCWSDYQTAMQQWSQMYRDGSINQRPIAQAFPPKVEGIPIDLLAKFAVIPFADTSVFALFRAWGMTNVPAGPIALALIALIALWAFGVRKRSDAFVLLGIAAWSFLADVFLPAYRNSYNDVLILNVVALATLILPPSSLVARLTIAAWPFGWYVMKAIPRDKFMINLPTLIMIFAAAVVIVRTTMAEKESEAAADQ